MSHGFVQVGVECPFPENLDFNGDSQEGAGPYQVTQRDSKRISAARGFLDPVQERPNLQLPFRPADLRDHSRQISWGYGVTLHVCELLPKSRGRIRFSSADPLPPTLIEANYLSRADDSAVMLTAVKIARRIMAAPDLATLIYVSRRNRVKIDQRSIYDCPSHRRSVTA